MPCPCRAHAMPMSRPCHALTIPFFSRPQHSTSVNRRPVGYLPTFGFFRLPRGVTRRLLSEAFQSQMQVASVKPDNVCNGRGKEWQQHPTKKKICQTAGLTVRIFPATTRTFTKDTALLDHGRDAAWRILINGKSW